MVSDLNQTAQPLYATPLLLLPPKLHAAARRRRRGGKAGNVPAWRSPRLRTARE